MKKTYYLLLLALLLFACQKEIEIDIPEQESTNVVHCYLSPDNNLDSNFVNVEIQRTQSLNNQSIQYVTDATVVLIEGNISIDTLIYSNELNRYVSETNLLTPESGKVYNLHVNSNNKVLTSSAVIPEKINIVETTFIPVSFKDQDAAAISEVGIVFQDPPNENNYYEILFVGYPENYPLFSGDGSIVSYDVSSEDEAITSESYYPTLIEFYLDKPKSLLFNDKTFNGELKILTINTRFRQSIGAFYGFRKQEVKITLRHVTEDYYLYKTKLYDHLYTQEEDILYGVGEPQELHSNITNGLGVLGSFNSSVNILFVDSMLIE
jgi:hypothetical protein